MRMTFPPASCRYTPGVWSGSRTRSLAHAGPLDGEPSQSVLPNTRIFVAPAGGDEHALADKRVAALPEACDPTEDIFLFLKHGTRTNISGANDTERSAGRVSRKRKASVQRRRRHAYYAVFLIDSCFLITLINWVR